MEPNPELLTKIRQLCLENNIAHLTDNMINLVSVDAKTSQLQDLAIPNHKFEAYTPQLSTSINKDNVDNKDNKDNTDTTAKPPPKPRAPRTRKTPAKADVVEIPKVIDPVPSVVSAPIVPIVPIATAKPPAKPRVSRAKVVEEIPDELRCTTVFTAGINKGKRCAKGREPEFSLCKKCKENEEKKQGMVSPSPYPPRDALTYTTDPDKLIYGNGKAHIVLEPLINGYQLQRNTGYIYKPSGIPSGYTIVGKLTGSEVKPLTSDEVKTAMHLYCMNVVWDEAVSKIINPEYFQSKGYRLADEEDTKYVPESEVENLVTKAKPGDVIEDEHSDDDDEV
jgi:hypothetical protein